MTVNHRASAVALLVVLTRFFGLAEISRAAAGKPMPYPEGLAEGPAKG